MNINIEDETLKASLEPECTIIHVIADHAALSESLKNPLKKIELTVAGVEEFDTAYFQLLLSFKATAEQKQIPFEIIGASEAIGNIGELYGISDFTAR